MPQYSGWPVRRGKGPVGKAGRQAAQRSLKRVTTLRATSGGNDVESRYNLLSCLAAAQACNIDFAGISWVEAQGDLGKGGQAVVSETRANLDVALAFKRRSPPDGERRAAIPKEKIDDAFRELTGEIWVLGQPAVRNHPNIVRLQALCWEILSTPIKGVQKTPQANDLWLHPGHEFKQAFRIGAFRVRHCLS